MGYNRPKTIFYLLKGESNAKALAARARILKGPAKESGF